MMCTTLGQGVGETPLTDLIEEELLAALEGKANPQEVLRRHSGSKGPLYTALARATAKAVARFLALRRQIEELRTKGEAAGRAAEEAEGRAGKAEARLKAAEGQLAQVAKAIGRQQALLDQAKELASAGFGQKALEKVRRLLVQAAAADGVSPAEAASRFLQAAEDYGRLIALQAQTEKAQQQAQAAEAAARERIARSKVQTQAVEGAEWFVKQQIPFSTVLAVRTVGMRLKLPPEKLAEGLAEALGEYGSLEAVLRAKAQERDELIREAEKLRTGNGALQKERRRIEAALQAVATGGRQRVEEARKAAEAAVRSVRREAEASLNAAAGRALAAMERYEAAARQAAELEQDVGFARALRSRDEAAWRTVDAGSWAALMIHLLRWLEARGLDPTVFLADKIPQALVDSFRLPTLYGDPRLSLRQLVVWVYAGLQGTEAAASLQAAGEK
jgi:hypothetical protein